MTPLGKLFGAPISPKHRKHLSTTNLFDLMLNSNLKEYLEQVKIPMITQSPMSPTAFQHLKVKKPKIGEYPNSYRGAIPNKVL